MRAGFQEQRIDSVATPKRNLRECQQDEGYPADQHNQKRPAAGMELIGRDQPKPALHAHRRCVREQGVIVVCGRAHDTRSRP